MNSDETEKLFENSFKYQSGYFQDGMAIDIQKNDNQPDQPWTFQLPSKDQKKNEYELKNHSNGFRVLTIAVFEYQHCMDNELFEKLKEVEQAEFF